MISSSLTVLWACISFRSFCHIITHTLYSVGMWRLFYLEMNIWFCVVFQRLLYCTLCATIDVNHTLFIYFCIYYCYHKCVIFNSYFAIYILMLCAQQLPVFRKMHTYRGAVKVHWYTVLNWPLILEVVYSRMLIVWKRGRNRNTYRTFTRLHRRQ